MIEIKEKKDCCGCEACVQICPRHCISLVGDEEGFYYPAVDKSSCTDCHLCEKTCPVINKGNRRAPLATYAAVNPNEEERVNSSSGGIFTYIAKKILSKGGVVFGARYDDHWNVVHAYTETIDGLGKFSGSKYVQSRIGESYLECKRFLTDGRLVLFTGTPCQVKALKLFLRKDYPNLYTADLVCHGVPSGKAWQSYLVETLEPDRIKQADRRSAAGKNSVLSLSLNVASALADIRFRDKKEFGWEKFCFVIRKKSGGEARQNTVLSSDIHYKHPYFSLFLSRVMERYSCYDCPAKAGKSGSDLTMGDYWGIDFDDVIKDDNKGVSLLMTHTDKGRKLAEGLIVDERPYEHAVACNQMIVRSIIPSKIRPYIYGRIREEGILKVSHYVQRRNLVIRAVNKLLRMMHVGHQILG